MIQVPTLFQNLTEQKCISGPVPWFKRPRKNSYPSKICISLAAQKRIKLVENSVFQKGFKFLQPTLLSACKNRRYRAGKLKNTVLIFAN